MKKTALVIMAAGIGSRYGAGIKQLARVGPSGELIIDYSIHDALEAGFDKIVFIIRHEIEEEFKEVIGDRIAKIAPVEYAFQELDDLPEGYSIPADRKKPLGTAQAVWCARNNIDCPFIVINADDFYGKGGFKKIHDYLVNEADEDSDVLDCCMAGYILGNTLSDHGTVARGWCVENEQGYLDSVTETFDIGHKDGLIKGKDAAGEEVEIPADAVVSMNMWGLPAKIIDLIGDEFPRFLDSLKPGDIKSEFLLPSFIDQLIKAGKARVKVLTTDDKWYGVTYHEDRGYVSEAICGMVKQGMYKEKLFD